MCPVRSTNSKKLSINRDTVLLVEGKDEANLFGAMIHQGCIDGTDIQVISAGGKPKFPANIEAIANAAKSRPTLRAMGVVRDADNDANAAFQSVCHHLKRVGYKPPSCTEAFSDEEPRVGVFIVPGGGRTGAIEALCRQSVQSSEEAHCVTQYLSCLVKKDVLHSVNQDKSFTHAYLAAQEDPLARVGEGARKGYWNFRDHAFQDLIRFVRDLISR